MEARNEMEILGVHETGLVMAIPAQPVEVRPGQAIRLYACKALGAAGPYARRWPVFTAILIAKKQVGSQLLVLVPCFCRPYRACHIIFCKSTVIKLS